MEWWQGLIVFFVVAITITGCVITVIDRVKGKK